MTASPYLHELVRGLCSPVLCTAVNLCVRREAASCADQRFVASSLTVSNVGRLPVQRSVEEDLESFPGVFCEAVSW